MAAQDAALAACKAQLEREFRGTGATFDDDLVRALLEINGNDANAVLTFLRQRPGDPEPQATNTDGTPRDYFKKPKGLAKLMGLSAARKPKVTSALKALFLADASLAAHVQAQVANYAEYASVLLMLLRHHVDMSSAVRACILTACIARRDWELTQYLLDSQAELFGLPEVLRAAQLLDAPREIRAIEGKLRRLEAQGTSKGGARARLQGRLNDIMQDGAHLIGEVRMSLSNSVCQRLKRWVRSISESKLNFFALSLPREPWRALADLLHLRPDDFSVPWFLPVAFGADPPAGSMVAECSQMNADSMVDIVARLPVPYSFLRRQVQSPETDLSDAIKTRVAEYESLKTIIWYYEELNCMGVDALISRRLEAGEEPELSYGKLMERLLLFRRQNAPFLRLLFPIAEKRLASMTLPLDPPVVVLGDASFSMDVAIRVSTIIASLLSYMANADLKFFSDVVIPAPRVPRSVADVLEVASTVRADGLTAPAVALWPYLTRKEVVQVFVVVTDEVENIPSQDYFFAQLFFRYYHEVHPARLVFVSFLERTQQQGRMVQALTEFGIEVLQFRLDQTRPDLTKLDALIGLLSAETGYFATQTNAMAEALRSGGLASLVDARELEAARRAAAEAEQRASAAHQLASSAIAENSERDSCRICMDRPIDTALLECGHMCCCGECSKGLQLCPMCRMTITRTIKVFKS